MITRSQIVATLTRWCEARDGIRAAWFGGSDASGRTDAWSDIDIQLIVPDDDVEETFAGIERALRELGPLAHAHRFPSPTWHGHEQAVFRLADSEPDHFVDLVVMRESAPNRFLEPERHGHPIAIVDRDAILANPPALDAEAHAARCAARRPELIERFELFQCLVTRAIARGHAAEAMQRYVGFTLGPLVELLRLRSCPDRFDFGLRYLDRDLPPNERERIEQLAFAGDLETLAAHHAEAVEWFRAVAADSITRS